MLQKYALEFYGLKDAATGYYIGKLANDLKNEGFIELLIEKANKEILTTQDYEDILKIQVILDYEPLIETMNVQEFSGLLIDFYKILEESNVDQKLIRKKLLLYINQNVLDIFKQDNYNIQKATLKICLSFSGAIKVWDEIITHTKLLLLERYFNELFGYTKKKDLNDLTLKMVNRILFPVSTKRYETQIEIALKIRKHFEEAFNKFKMELYSFFELEEFKNLTNVEQVKMLRDTLGFKILGLEGEIQLKDKLEEAEKIFDANLKESGMQYEISSKEFADSESLYTDFRDKFYLLIYRENFPIYQFMQYQNKESKGLLDYVSNMEGIKHEKYGNVAFMMNFHYFETLMVLETIHLITNYKEVFWDEFLKLVIDVEGLTGISEFLKTDIRKLEKFVNEKDYFLASSFLAQLIERLLRELMLKLLYGVSGIFKEATFTLGKMLDINSDNILNEIFTNEEIETMEYFLVNKEYGLNLRNNLAHYNVNSEEVGIEIFARLMHILTFILIKVNFQGTKFDES
ncbi:DUF4209 domain-containing protein [Bacillus bingmayongensis]|uniref:DUF4209 domain-containing protein n=1 Tax=Bacillus bingmayongensis TaxID=1150157 RepID=UPI001C8D83F4|nr:DUF4209 domain-containing protein [Bacillus bingmayongensis]MBY0597353.1 hypothetical protein [Bacillus bingmayongensis]